MFQDAINIRTPLQEGVDRKSRLEILSMSARGLLDYTEDDTSEATFEASMFGELFLEMLQYRFGHLLLRTLPLIAQQVCILLDGLQGSKVATSHGWLLPKW